MFENILRNFKKNSKKTLNTVKKFFRKYCTNLSKFTKIAFNIDLNFIKLSNISKTF